MSRRKSKNGVGRRKSLDEAWHMEPHELEAAIRGFMEGKDEDGNLPEIVKKPSGLIDLYKTRPRLAKSCAYNDYVLGEACKTISDRYGIPYNTLMTWVCSGKKSWKVIRENIERKYVETIVEQNIEEIGMTMSMMLNIVRSSLVKLVQDSERISINDLPKLTKALTDLHRFSRIKQNLPTDITELVSKKSAKDIVDEINLLDEEFLAISEEEEAE